MEADGCYGDVVNDDAALSGFQKPEERQGEGGFTCPCPPHNAHLETQQKLVELGRVVREVR
jgi:hypothetical protein